MNDAVWIKSEVGWWEEDWLFVLSAEAQLAWNKIQHRAKSHGMAGRLRKTDTAILAKLWLQGEESIIQMLRAAELAGKLTTDDDHWTLTDWRAKQGDPTGADRQRRFKERQKGNDGNASPPLHRESNTEEKRREEKRRETPYNPPPGDLASFQGMETAWPEWVKYRGEKRQKLTQTTITRQVAFLMSQPDPAACIAQSITNGWTGLFPVKDQPSPQDGHDPYAGIERAGAR